MSLDPGITQGVPPIDVGSGIAVTPAAAAAAATRRSSLDSLRSLLGPAFSSAAVTTDYGAPTWGSGQPHSGIDLAAAQGTPIQNPIGGTVSRVWTDSVGGNQVAIKTPQGYTEVFAHLAYIPAFVYNTPGAGVPQGGIVGYVGQTGVASGPHLHYEVTKPGGTIGTILGTIDPLSFISEFATGTTAPTTAPSYTDPQGTSGGNSGNACANVPLSVIKSVNDYIGPAAVLNALTGTDAAAQIKSAFPDVPLACLRQIAYDAGAAEASAAMQANSLGNLAGAVGSVAGNIGQLTGDLTNGQTWARVGLTLAAVGLIGLGVVLYVGSAAPKPRLPV